MSFLLQPFLKTIFLGLITILFVLECGLSTAQANSWRPYKDEDGIFHVLMPDNYKINRKSFRINDRIVIASNKVDAIIDERPYKDIIKTFSVKYDQTFASLIREDDIPDLLTRDINKYIDYYESIGGVIRDKEMGSFNGRPGGEVVFAYKGKDKKLKSARIRVIYSNTTRVEQVMAGPEDTMFAFTWNDFFKSLNINEGNIVYDGDPQSSWENITSPFALSVVNVPKKSLPYIPQKMQSTHNNKIEKLSLQIYDPVYDNIMFYNVYGYRFNTLMNMHNVQEVLMGSHMGKFTFDTRQLKISQGSAGEYPVLSAKVHFSPPDAYPHMNTIKLNAYYYGPFLVVQELLGSNLHVESLLSRRLMSGLTFTPIEGNKKMQEERSAANMKALQETSAGEE